ncbi:hypothetical protein FH063_004615 [Azospirillum argentinense]|uniref:Uncharacterized protein n=1 Tax=Azospirillum argentinense TaxID=2970906 RepID=A0A5B0KUS8_9PROT|nr:hypothetical protein FH063_004615 [Azospirillum argentinense]
MSISDVSGMTMPHLWSLGNRLESNSQSKHLSFSQTHQ